VWHPRCVIYDTTKEISSSDRSQILYCTASTFFIGCTTWWWPFRGRNMYLLVITTVCYIYIYIYIYGVSQKECARLREGVPYVKVYRYNPKHLCPKSNGYGDNGQRKVWSSSGSTHCTCHLTSLIDVCPWVWCPIQLTLAVQLCSRLIPECTVSHVTSVLAIHVSCIVLGTLRTTMTCVRDFL